MDPVTAAGIAVLLLAVAATATFWRRAVRRGAGAGVAAASALAFGSGLVTVGLATGHLLGVVITELHRSPLSYDFRVYALLLLGSVLGALGMRLTVAAIGLARGERAAWRSAVTAAVMLLMVNAPLAPIQGFAVALCVFALIGLVPLLTIRRRVAQSDVGA